MGFKVYVSLCDRARTCVIPQTGWKRVNTLEAQVTGMNDAPAMTAGQGCLCGEVTLQQLRGSC